MADDVALSVQLDEARLARDEALLKATQLRSELGQVRRQLDAVRRDYAELLVKAKSEAEAFADLQLRIAELLTGVGETSSAGDAIQAYEALNQVHRQHAGLYQEIRAFGDYLESILDVLQPSEVLEREMTGRYERLVREIDRLERMPSLVAGRGGNEPRVRRQCRVLAVNDDLQVVVLNAGRNDGVHPGSDWFVTDGSVVAGRLTVIESRPAVSAAISTKGDLELFAPGIVVHLEHKTREE